MCVPILNIYLQSGKCVAQLLGHTGSVNCLVAGDSLVWSASGDNTVRGWDAKVCHPCLFSFFSLLTSYYSEWQVGVSVDRTHELG